MAHGPGPDSPLLWTLAAPSVAGLAGRAGWLHRHLAADPELRPEDVARTLGAAPGEGPFRAAIVAADRTELLARLAALADGGTPPGLLTGTAGDGRTAFVFPGQGSQWTGMAAELLDTAPVFRDRLDECAQALEPFTGWSVPDVLRQAPGAPSLTGADVVQPALWAVTVALAALWQSYGIEPGAVLGHSMGEIGAAVVADALSLEDAARVVAHWSRLQATLAGRGDMVSVMASAERVRPLLERWDGRLAVAAVNGPGSVVVSGDADAAAELVEALGGSGIHARRVMVGLAAHSPHIEAILPELREVLAPLRPRPARLPFYSGATGGLLADPVLDADHWCRNLRDTVLFGPAARAMLLDGHRLLLEVSPHPVLTSALQETAQECGADARVRGSLRRDQGDRTRVLTALGELFVDGHRADLAPLAGEFDGRLLELPAGAEPAPAEPAGAAPGPDLATRLAGLAGPEQHALLLDLVHRAVRETLGRTDRVDPQRAFLDLGFDSVSALEVRTRLGAATGLRLPATAVFDHPTPAALAEFVRLELTGGAVEPEPQRRTLRADRDDQVVIVSMGCRLPGGADTPDRLWELVAQGVDAVSPFPDRRGWDLAEGYRADGGEPGRYYQREAGFLHEADEFDAEFFGISPREALAMDPQQRLLLETSWEALERAGIDPTTLRGSRSGVFVGAMTMDYGPGLVAGSDLQGHLLTGNTGSVVSGRLAYSLGLEGAAVTVDTACSSSLVALHLAVRSLRDGECDLALAGGVTVMSTLGMFMEFSRQGGLAPDGRCKAFSAAADGFGLAEGAGIVVLERLSDARRNGHPVLAFVRGSAVNQDGASNGLTAPNGPSQQRVIRTALADAGLTGAEVDAVEAHGTGTRLGDPIEAQAILATYGRGRPDGQPLWLGSLKSNLGHAQAAAGVAGVMKMVLAMRHGLLPKTLHVTGPNPEVDWSAGAVELLTEARVWPGDERPRRAGVSSFGISGTNAHVILEQAPAPEASDRDEAEPDGVVWLLSARSPKALREQAERLLTVEQDTRDIAHTLATGRTRFDHRAVATGNRTQLRAALTALTTNTPHPALTTNTATTGGRTVFVFPGQGSQWPGMAAELLDTEPAFARRIAECEDALNPHVDWSLTHLLRTAQPLDRVEIVQPALFAVMISLAATWQHHGIHPDAVLGHSQGEIAAAVVAGALTLQDGAKIAALRAQALTQLRGTGGMTTINLPPDHVTHLIQPWPDLTIAAHNSPTTTVVAGPTHTLQQLHTHCTTHHIRHRPINVDYASHTPHIDTLHTHLTNTLTNLNPQT
ncbi:acyltransferase domain-containing protein, partial [Kitasatospora sp. NPDC094015]|uniref:acyltransferase domain-containing protein n=1 Tax=Kitasatospora sp. NPDC094015 TaxID=3155205 RepID=UPI00331EE4B8